MDDAAWCDRRIRGKFILRRRALRIRQPGFHGRRRGDGRMGGEGNSRSTQRARRLTGERIDDAPPWLIAARILDKTESPRRRSKFDACAIISCGNGNKALSPNDKTVG